MKPVQLCKGFVGITADGRKAFVSHQDPEAKSGNVWLVSVEDASIGRYLTNGRQHILKKDNLRIVAPYPPEKPFANGIVYDTCYHVLDTTDGSIHVADFIDFVRGVNTAEYALQIRRQGGDERGWFFWDGKGCEKVSHYRVLGPAEERPAPKKRGMTRKRWEEVRTRLQIGFGYPVSDSEKALRELVTWIESARSKSIDGVLLEFDEPEVEYEPHDIVSMAEELRGEDPRWIRTSSNPQVKILGVQQDGVRVSIPGGQLVIGWKVLAAEYRWNDRESRLPVARIKKTEGT